jgi:predicted metal-dependent HD superfamily phosphohydrolase
MVARGSMDDLERHVRSRLEEGLPPTLTYHGAHHTMSDVLPAVDRICQGERVPEAQARLVRAAVLFHDLGFVEAYHGNEPISARLAARTLPAFGYSDDEIGRIADLILSTEIREVGGVWVQVPGDDPLKRILCDADLDNLGRDDFFEVSDSLRRELELQGEPHTDRQWCVRQIAFVSGHRWFTATQHRDREPGKRRNLELLRQELSTLP